LYDKGNYEDMKQYFGSLDWNQYLQRKNVDEMWSVISDTIYTAVEKWVPHKVFKPGLSHHKRALWMNDRAFLKIKQKKAAFQRFKETNDGKD